LIRARPTKRILLPCYPDPSRKGACSMAQTSAFCLVQQSIHHARSLSETLPNARGVALAAANAWGREAKLAASAERRRATRRQPFLASASTDHRSDSPPTTALSRTSPEVPFF